MGYTFYIVNYIYYLDELHNMMVDEMADFFYQNLMGMGETYLRATQDQAIANDFKEFAYSFYKKFSASQIAENK